MEYFNYLQSQSIEEKIVGIIQCQKYLQENLQQNIDFNCNEYLEILINTATPKFLIQMLHTKFQGPNFTIQNVAISLLEIICEKHPSLLQNFSNFCFELFQLSFQENKYNKRLFDLAMVIRELSKLDSVLQLMFVKTLEFVCSNSLDSLAAFGGLIEIASNLNQHMSLSSQHSKQLRDVLVQGLKSSAREKYRDNFFIAVMVFLSRLDPVWTQDQKFIMFLVSLICGEYRLLLQELTTLAEHTEETSSNLEIIDQRIDRCEKLLFGEMSEVNGSWHNLLATTLQLIQKEMTQSIELFLQFVHLSKPKLQNTQINFYTVVARGIISFTAWIREDESLHPIFVDTYEDLVEFSRIPVIDSRSPHANISDDLKNRIRATLFQSSSNNSLNMSDFDRYVGGIGSILILQRKSSLHATQQGIATTNEPSYHLLIITESILDPFLSTLDTIVDLLSSDIVSERLTSVAICGVPYIFSTLSTLLFDILSFVGQSSSTFMSTPIQHDLSLCLMLSDILLALVVSPSNQMMNSLEILAASTDPEAGEYLKVSTSACKYLLFQINQLTDMRNVNHTLTEEEIIDFHNLIERLRSLEEIFQNLFQRPHQSHLI